MTGEPDPDGENHHPSQWMDSPDMQTLMLRAMRQRHVDLIALSNLAAGLGVALDIAEAIGSLKSAADLVEEIRVELKLRSAATYH
jgi:hypothetical protein